MHTQRTILLLLLFLLCARYAAAQPALLERAGWRLLQESAAPRVTIRDAEGERVRFADTLGENTTIINFWATWCEPCIEELPDLQRLHTFYSAQGLRIILVNAQENPRTTQKFLDDLGITIESYYDTRGRLLNRFGVRVMPVSFLANSEGRIFARYIGIFPWTSDAIRDVWEYSY